MLYIKRKSRIYLTILIFVIFCLILINNKSNYFATLTENEQLSLKNTREEYSDFKETFCLENTLHSTCFLGKKFCHPGYFNDCNLKKSPANPWYTEDCPNLKMPITWHKDMPFELISQGKKCLGEILFNGISKCAYLCFSHPISGVAQVPIVYWKRMLMNEIDAWKLAEGSDDRGMEHQLNFNQYVDLPENLGNFIEIGAGPYTQTQFLVFKNKNFDNITFLDPGAESYMSFTKNCKYKNESFFGRKVRILNYGAENVQNDPYFGQYDALMSINVIEHVSDAFYVLSNLYGALKKNGILIYHDRYFKTPESGNGILGNGNRFHPIRLKKNVFDHFLSKFEKIFLNMKPQGDDYGVIYFIGRKI